MDSSFYLGIVVAVTTNTLLGIIFFMVYRRFPNIIKRIASSRNRNHEVFLSFLRNDVRKSFLSHLINAFNSKAIGMFIDDDDIQRCMIIGRNLKGAIRGSRIVIVLLSRNYASSSWCLNGLVEIMKSREESGKTVMALFYDVDPTDVKNQTGDFGEAFEETCKGKTEEEIERWRLALKKVAKIACYHSSNWLVEAEMVKEITNDISNMLEISTPSSDFTGLVGMEAHMEKLEAMLCLELDEVRMIGIWGPCGIGKTTIAIDLFTKHSDCFDLSVFMENVKGCARPWFSGELGFMLDLQKQFLSQIFNEKDIEVPHLGVAQDRLKDKKVLVVLDDVDQAIQLDAMAKETQWFGPGSRIIITTQDKRLLKEHGIKDIYKVNFPLPDEAYQIFCMNAFGQNSPKDGFEVLSWKAVYLNGIHPLGIRNAGYKFQGLSKQEWVEVMSELKRTANKQKCIDAIKNLWNNPGSVSLLVPRMGNKIIYSVQKGFLSQVSSIMDNYRVKIAADAATRIYERCVKEFEEKENVESSGVSLTPD